MRVEPNTSTSFPRTRTWRSWTACCTCMTPPRRRPHGPHLPVDYFFRSLAADQGPRAIGIVLSGTGIGRHVRPAGDQGDGRHHVRAGARQREVRRHAAQRARERLGRLLPAARGHRRGAGADQPAPVSGARQARRRRRCRRAWASSSSSSAPRSATTSATTSRPRSSAASSAGWRCTRSRSCRDYVKFVQSNADELRQLYKDMLISVTSFFRDTRAVRGAEDQGVSAPAREQGDRLAHPRLGARLLDGRGGVLDRDLPARVPGRRAADYRIQIFGTDVDEASVQRARRGVYPQNIALDVSPERLQRFFVKKETEYQVAAPHPRHGGVLEPERHQGRAVLAARSRLAAATCSSTCAPACRRRCCASSTTR